MELVKSLRSRNMLDLHTNGLKVYEYRSIIAMRMLKTVFLKQFGLNEDVFNLIVSYVAADEMQSKRFWNFRICSVLIGDLRPNYTRNRGIGTEKECEESLVNAYQGRKILAINDDRLNENQGTISLSIRADLKIV